MALKTTDMKLNIDNRIFPITPIRISSDDQNIDSKSKSDNTDQMLGKRRAGRPPYKEETITKHRKRHEHEALLA